MFIAAPFTCTIFTVVIFFFHLFSIFCHLKENIFNRTQLFEAVLMQNPNLCIPFHITTTFWILGKTTPKQGCVTLLPDLVIRVAKHPVSVVM
jgi:hypothetical protein